jgi:hypothetical protein
MSVPAVCGIRMALETGHGRTAVPVRSTVLGAALSVVIITAAVTFATSLGRLFDRPELYGWNWDAQLGDEFAGDLGEVATNLTENPAAAEVALATSARLQIGDLPVDTLGIEPRQGSIAPVVVAGRAARRPDEILLGTRTLRRLGVDIGATVPVTLGDRTAHMRVVGRGVLSEFAGSARLGEGAATTFEGLKAVMPDAIRNVVLVRFRPGADPSPLLAEFRGSDRARFGANLSLPEKPSDLADLERIGGVPLGVAALLGLMTMATLAHTLVTSVRRRRPDLAMLKVLGLVRAQVSAAVRWQASTLALAALLFGLPIGIVTGRWVWEAFADRLGVPPQPVTPVLAIALLVPATAVIVNLIAVVPARLATGTKPAATLRTE